jgi:dTDP-4-amino-4,6-dideoxygalactose transaminase
MRSEFLSFSPPCISTEECDEVLDTMASQWISTGPKTRQFEEEFMSLIGSEDALALNSCTAGLHVALMVLDVKPGDQVITTPMTFCSSVNVIEHVGARPVLVDVQPDTLCISPERIEEAITTSTKCILPVHYSGHPCDMDPIMALAREHHLHVVEDAAHSLPARYRGRTIGTIGHLTAFSFYATKNLTTAEGGMLTGAQEFIERARVISLHGMSKDAWKRYDKGGSWYYEVVSPGYKYNMTDIHASIGLRQLRKLTGFQEQRREIVRLYKEAFSNYAFFDVPVERPDVEHAWHLYVLRLNLETLRIGRDQFIEELKMRNIGTSVHFIPVHVHPYYRDKYGFKPDDFPVAYSNYLRMISLPLHPGLSQEDASDVIAAVVDVATLHRR